MKSSLVLAGLVGAGIVSWRVVAKDHRLPPPGAIGGVTALFLALAVVADVWPASATLVTLSAWGLDVAGLLNLLPNAVNGKGVKASPAPAPGTGKPALV